MIGRDKLIACRVGICTGLVLNKAYYKYKSCASFFWELNDQRLDRNTIEIKYYLQQETFLMYLLFVIEEKKVTTISHIQSLAEVSLGIHLELTVTFNFRINSVLENVPSLPVSPGNVFWKNDPYRCKGLSAVSTNQGASALLATRLRRILSQSLQRGPGRSQT